MIKRYSLPEMEKIWELENRFQKMLDVEIAVCEAWNRLGKIPSGALKRIKQKARIDTEDILKKESVTKHDVIAFLTSLEKKVGPASKYIHLGLTSSDVVDTAFVLLVLDAHSLIMRRMARLTALLRGMTQRHRLTYMMGRTHGVHAEILTFGFKTAIWYQEALRNTGRMKEAERQMRFGKISGAVGTYTNLDPRLETMALKKLGLSPEPISSQIIQRDRFAVYIQALSLVASFIEKIALEIRLLQKTETLEVEEPFSRGQKGSSAMPHKHNPVSSEQLCGLSRLVRSHVIPALENIALWHERDISHSSVERVIFPDATILVHYMLSGIIRILEGLTVNKKNMLKNIGLTRGLIFSQNLLIRLVEKGLGRNRAYELIQKQANEAWRTGGDFREMIYSNRQIGKYLNRKELDQCFNYRFNEKKILWAIKRAVGG